jgi:hypothetical protein
MLDAVGIDALLDELRPLLSGRRLDRPRACGRDAICFRLPRAALLRLDAGRGRAGVYLLEADEAASLPAPRPRSDGAGGGAAGLPSGVPILEPSPRTRQALLLIRKHAEGRRIAGLARVPGRRTVLFDLGSCVLALRLSGLPSLALAVEGALLATLGEGPPPWPPEPLPQSEWDVVAVSAVSEAAGEARSRGLDPWRGVLSVCPGLGPLLARLTDGSPASFEALRSRLRSPAPRLLAPAPPADWTDRALAEPASLALAAIDPGPAAHGRVVLEAPSWRSAVALFLSGRLRGDAFGAARQRASADAAREVRRLERLLARLEEDRHGVPEPALLRRQAEALLAALPRVPAASGDVEVEDPYEPGRVLTLRLDPALGPAANADRLFEKARRLERASALLDDRVVVTRAALERARRRQESVRAAASLDEIEPVPEARPASRGAVWGGLRQYLTTRGLPLLAGRGARENHRVTFAVAGPEDLWLHARDVPGAHVVLRDPEGRAVDQDVREAAEVAAWFSASRAAAAVDVSVARRKHLRPVRGSPGRVRIGHSETVRVSPRDPEGRLRRRASRGV